MEREQISSQGVEVRRWRVWGSSCSLPLFLLRNPHNTCRPTFPSPPLMGYTSSWSLQHSVATLLPFSNMPSAHSSITSCISTQNRTIVHYCLISTKKITLIWKRLKVTSILRRTLSTWKGWSKTFTPQAKSRLVNLSRSQSNSLCPQTVFMNSVLWEKTMAILRTPFRSKPQPLGLRQKKHEKMRCSGWIHSWGSAANWFALYHHHHHMAEISLNSIPKRTRHCDWRVSSSKVTAFSWKLPMDTIGGLISWRSWRMKSKIPIFVHLSNTIWY